MKKILKTALMVLVTGMVFCSSDSITLPNTVNAAAPKIKVGEKFSVSSLKLKPNSYVLDYKSADVTGDKIKDDVVLVGIKENKNDIFSAEAVVVVQDGKTKKYLKVSTGDFGGYGGDLFLGDFNKDKVSDVMTTLGTGGSGGTINTNIFSFKNNKTVAILSANGIGEGLTFEGKFVDGFKAEVLNKESNKTFTIDLRGVKDYYTPNSIYDEKGKLLSPVEIAADGFVLLEPVDWDCDGSYELQGSQAIWGICHADTIANVESVLDFESSKWNVIRLEYSSFLIR